MTNKILLIDDEKDFTELTRVLFEFHGFEAEAINDPIQGLKRLGEQQFDAVVVDIMMPGMDGLTLIGHMRTNPYYATKPVFVLSAKNLSDAERKDLLVKNIHFISKPFEPRRLVELIRNNLDGVSK